MTSRYLVTEQSEIQQTYFPFASNKRTLNSSQVTIPCIHQCIHILVAMYNLCFMLCHLELGPLTTLLPQASSKTQSLQDARLYNKMYVLTSWSNLTVFIGVNCHAIYFFCSSRLNYLETRSLFHIYGLGL